MECCDQSEVKIGPVIRGADLEIKRALFSCIRKQGIDKVTAANGYILKYLSENTGRDVFQKDIESVFNIGKSGVTCVLNLMEENGYVSRSSVDWDARLKKITLTDKGVEVNGKIEKTIVNVDRQLLCGISEAEFGCFIDVLERISQNAVKIRKESDTRTQQTDSN